MVKVVEIAGGSRSQYFRRLTTLGRVAVGVSNEETARRRASSPMTKNRVLATAESVWSKEGKRGKQSIGIRCRRPCLRLVRGYRFSGRGKRAWYRARGGQGEGFDGRIGTLRSQSGYGIQPLRVFDNGVERRLGRS